MGTHLSDPLTTESHILRGDKAGGSYAIRELSAFRGMVATHPAQSKRKDPVPYDVLSYNGRHLIENTFMDTKP